VTVLSSSCHLRQHPWPGILLLPPALAWAIMADMPRTARADVGGYCYHVITVLRYIERNALRAALVGRAEEWAWSSLPWWLNPGSLPFLDPGPVPRPADWLEHVNRPATEQELERLRHSVQRGCPYGRTVLTCGYGKPPATSAWTQPSAVAADQENGTRLRGIRQCCSRRNRECPGNVPFDSLRRAATILGRLPALRPLRPGEPSWRRQDEPVHLNDRTGRRCGTAEFLGRDEDHAVASSQPRRGAGESPGQVRHRDAASRNREAAKQPGRPRRCVWCSTRANGCNRNPSLTTT